MLMSSLDFQTIINIVALFLAPIIAVVVGQYLQNRAKKRDDKMNIFKTLMTNRIFSWTPESVYALNSIDIVFADNKKVCKQWKEFYDSLCVGNADNASLKKIEKEKYKLLEVMANSLGYKGKITWEIIQNPYIPQGMSNSMQQQQNFRDMYAGLVGKMNVILPNQFNVEDAVSKTKSSKEA